MAIDVGDRHACVIVSTGGVKCWGGNENGQLGIGNRVPQNSPTADVDLGQGNVVYVCICTSEASGLKYESESGSQTVASWMHLSFVLFER